MSQFLDRLFGNKLEINLAKAEYESVLSFDRSQVDKHLLAAYLNKGLSVENNDYSSFLKTCLSRESKKPISLADELTALEAFVCLHRACQDEELFVKMVAVVHPGTLSIYPFILFPLVQNAIQHGYNSMERYPVKINIKIVGDRLQMEVSNRVNHYISNQAETELIHFYRQRLINCYPNKYDLLVNSNSSTFKATLNINLG